nr:MAG TPA: hypothetical protein [Caudoviricetes sp.]
MLKSTNQTHTTHTLALTIKYPYHVSLGDMVGSTIDF